MDEKLIERIKTEIDLKTFISRELNCNFKNNLCIEHDSLRITYYKGHQSYFWNSKGEKGSIIDFVINNCRGVNNFKEAVELLANYINNPSFNVKNDEYEPNVNKKSNNKELVLNYSKKGMKRTFGYLCSTRKIQYKIITELINKGLIKQDIKDNIMFLHIDENDNIVGADIKGTSSYRKFKGVLENSNQNYGFSFTVGRSIKNIYVFEAPIDLISYYQLFKGELHNSLLLSLGGSAKTKIISTYLNIYKEIENIFICSDNDDAGIKCYINCKESYKDKYNIIDNRQMLIKNNVKDFNELLVKEKL